MTSPGESLFAVRRTYVSRPIFDLHREPHEYVECVVVAAESEKEAVDFAIRGSSVAAVKDGLTVEVIEIDWKNAVRVHATYDREPLDGSHASTGAKLIVSPA